MCVAAHHTDHIGLEEQIAGRNMALKSKNFSNKFSLEFLLISGQSVLIGFLSFHLPRSFDECGSGMSVSDQVAFPDI